MEQSSPPHLKSRCLHTNSVFQYQLPPVITNGNCFGLGKVAYLHSPASILYTQIKKFPSVARKKKTLRSAEHGHYSRRNHSPRPMTCLTGQSCHNIGTMCDSTPSHTIMTHLAPACDRHIIALTLLFHHPASLAHISGCTLCGAICCPTQPRCHNYLPLSAPRAPIGGFPWGLTLAMF